MDDRVPKPTIASTFWKKTIQGAISCDQPTRFDSLLAVNEAPGRGEELRRHRWAPAAARRPGGRARRTSPRSNYRAEATSSLRSPRRRSARLPAVVGDELHPPPCGSRARTHQRSSPARRSSRFSPSSASSSRTGFSVVEGRDPVAGQDGRVREPARHVQLGRRAEDLLVGRTDRLDQRVRLLDLGPRSRDVAQTSASTPSSPREARAPSVAPPPSARPAAPAGRGRGRSCGVREARHPARPGLPRRWQPRASP